LVATALYSYDNAHFYRATNLFFEPRIDRDYLTTIDLFFQTGSTSESWNANHHKVPLFDLYGSNNMHELGVGVPDKDLSNPLDMILTQLSLTPSRCATSTDSCKRIFEFAAYSIDGNFSIMEGIISFMQNWKHGFFFQLHMPVRKLNVRNITFCDISPTDNKCPNINTPIWQTFKDNFDAILTRYHLSRDCYSDTTLGDFTALIGWTHSFQQTELLDFVDTTFKVGILIPSGDEKNEDLIFSLPSSYNKHIGANIHADFAFGAFDWFTMGGHFDVTIFADKTRSIRMKTGPVQSGIIKLAKGQAKEEEGTLWHTGAYLKADHVLRGLSFLFGYSYAGKNRNYLTPCDTDKYPPSTVNSDAMLFDWNMHTIHLWLEYDFAKENGLFGPRISFFYNRPVGGKRVFTTDMFGGNVGLDITWNV
jgi:hypothetical protein